MKKLKTLAPLLVMAALCSSCAMIPKIAIVAPALTIYQIASARTGAPERIIKGFHFAESSFGKNVNHPDPWDVGEFALHETPAIHAERAAKWGEYNANNALEAATIAGRIYMENLDRTGSEYLAVCSYRQGVQGVRDDGPGMWYYQRVAGTVLRGML